MLRCRFSMVQQRKNEVAQVTVKCKSSVQAERTLKLHVLVTSVLSEEHVTSYRKSQRKKRSQSLSAGHTRRTRVALRNLIT